MGYITYAKLNGSREELDTSGLGDGITASHTRQVNESGLDDALLALGGLDDSLGESNSRLGTELS